MNNDEQDMQPQKSQAADNESEEMAGDNMMDMNGDEAGDEAGDVTANQAAPDGGMDTMAGDTGAADDENMGDADVSDAGATDDSGATDDAGAMDDADTMGDAGSIGDADAVATDMASDVEAESAGETTTDVEADAVDADTTTDVEADSAVDDTTDDADAGDIETAAADDAASGAGASDIETAAADSAVDAEITGDATDMGAPDMAAMSASNAGATDDAAVDDIASDESPAMIIAEEARDEQDAQMPGEVDTPAEVEAAPQIAQASETSQAEGEPEAADTADAAVDMGEAAAVEAPEMEMEAGEGAVMSADTGADEYEEPIVRSTRLQDVSADASMEDLLRASEQQYRTLKHGDVVEGTVMKVGRDEILVDIGAKTEGIIPSAELQSLTTEEREALSIGDPLLVSVVQTENNEGHAVLSLDRARQERSWRDLQKRFEAGEVIQARVTGYNKGGLLVNLEGVRGFVPSSQISSLTGGPEAQKQSEMAKLQNQTIPMKIIEINRSRNRLILSERQAMQEQRESVRSRLLRDPGKLI